MRKRSILALGGALAIIASLVVGPAATAGPERASAGTVVDHSRPGAGNPQQLPRGRERVHRRAGHEHDPRGRRDLRQQGRPQAVSSHGRSEAPQQGAVEGHRDVQARRAVWSDGKPITGADFLATYKTIMNPDWDIVSREGWEDIAKIQVKGKSFTVTFKKGRAYAAWDVLLGSSPLPAHKVAGQDFNKLWSNSIDISSGPFKFQSWQVGTQLTMVRNPAFKAAAKAKIDRIVFKLHRRCLAVPGAEERRGRRRRAVSAADPDRRLLQGHRLQGGGRHRLLVGAPRIPAGCEGSPGAEAEVRPPGHHPGHQPGTDPRRAVRKDRARQLRQGAARFFRARYSSRSSPGYSADLREVEVQPAERHRSAEEERLHRRAR